MRAWIDYNKLMNEDANARARDYAKTLATTALLLCATLPAHPTACERTSLDTAMKRRRAQMQATT
jgi:hypothetical protein